MTSLNYQPHLALRARDNPFRSDRVLQIRYQLHDVTWTNLLVRLEHLSFKAAIVGPHGSGKTTLLEDFQPYLQARGFNIWSLRLDEEHPHLAPGTTKELCQKLTSSDLVLLDGAEQMSPVTWLRFRWITRNAGGLLITTHQEGRLPTLWRCHTTPNMLAHIASQLLNVSTQTIHCQAVTLFKKHDGNLRHALREWYDIFSEGGVTRRPPHSHAIKLMKPPTRFPTPQFKLPSSPPFES